MIKEKKKEAFHTALLNDDFVRAERQLHELQEEADFKLLKELFRKVPEKRPLLTGTTGRLPTTICICPSYTCHLGCQFCVTGFCSQTKAYDDEDYLSAEDFRKLLPWLRHAKTLSFCGIGETLESADMFKYLEILEEENLREIPINIVTNTMPLNRQNITKFVHLNIQTFTFSIDSISPWGHGGGNEEYQQKTWKKVRWIQEEKQRQRKEVPYMLVNSVLTKESLETLPAHLDTAYEHGINEVQLVFMIPRNMEFYHLSLLPDVEENLRRVKAIIKKWRKTSMKVNLINGQSRILSDTPPFCYKIGKEASFLRDPHYPIPCCGDLTLPHKATPEYSLECYWNSFPLRFIRHAHHNRKKGSLPVSCQECSELGVEIAAQIKKEQLMHPEDDLYDGYAEGVGLKNKGKNEEAKALLKKTLAKRGSHATRGRIYLHLCEIALMEEKYDEAMEHIQKAVYYQFNHRKAFSYLYLLAMLTGKEPQLQGQ